MSPKRKVTVAEVDQAGAAIRDALEAMELEVIQSLPASLVTDALVVAALEARAQGAVVVLIAMEAAGGIVEAAVIARGRAG